MRRDVSEWPNRQMGCSTSNHTCLPSALIIGAPPRAARLHDAQTEPAVFVGERVRHRRGGRSVANLSSDHAVGFLQGQGVRRLAMAHRIADQFRDDQLHVSDDRSR